MSLTDKLNRLYDSNKKNIRDYAIVSAIGVSTFFAPIINKAADIYVDPSMPYTEINEFIDGDGEGDADAGDTIRFAFPMGSDPYQLPQQQGASYRLQIDGVNLDKKFGDSNPVFGGDPNSSSTIVWIISSKDNTISNFITKNAYLGFLINGYDYDNINFVNVNTNGHNIHYEFDHQYAVEPTTEPSITGNGLYINGGSVGIHFAEGDIGTANPMTKYFSFSNLTADNLYTLIDGPIIFENNLRTIKGEFSDSIVINSVELFPDYDLFDFNFETAPSGFVEWNNESKSLYKRGVGENNIEANPLLNTYIRPLPNSPAIGPQYVKGYSGAFPQAGNFDGDPDVDLKDASTFQLGFSGNQGANIEYRIVHDFDGDLDIDLDDFTYFLLAVNGPK